MKEIIFTQWAKRELDESEEWYERKEIGLGQRFKSEVKDEVLWLSNYPLAGSLLPKSTVRCKVMNQFPFYIYYEIWGETNTLIILAIAHQRRKPDYWKSK